MSFRHRPKPKATRKELPPRPAHSSITAYGRGVGRSIVGGPSRVLVTSRPPTNWSRSDRIYYGDPRHDPLIEEGD